MHTWADAVAGFESECLNEKKFKAAWNSYWSHNFKSLQGELLKNGKARCKMGGNKNIALIGTPLYVVNLFLTFCKLHNYDQYMMFRLKRPTTIGGHGTRWEAAHVFLFEKCVIVCKEGKR